MAFADENCQKVDCLPGSSVCKIDTIIKPRLQVLHFIARLAHLP